MTRFTGTHGHLDQCPWPVALQRFLEISGRLGLGGPKIGVT
jgi:hypothetical protein